MVNVDGPDRSGRPQGNVHRTDEGIRVGRWLPTQFVPAARNMAIDAAVLENVQPDDGWTLRLYGWNPPALSLGYFQTLGSRSLHRSSMDLPLVRRATGGGAIVHHHELTYSLIVGDRTLQQWFADEMTNAVVGSGQPEATSDLTRWWYRAVHGAVMTALEGFGIQTRFAADRRETVSSPESAFLCFRRRADEDVEVGGYKVLGSAQRRARGGRLMHGGLLMAASEHAAELPGIYELTGKRPGWAEMGVALSRELARRLRIEWAEGHLGEAERASSETAHAERFAAESWTRRR